MHSTVCMYIYIYIYLYCHPQTDCFIVSQLFKVARHVGHLKLRSKPAQLYVRLSIRPLGQLEYHVSLGNYKVLCSNISSNVRLFTFYALPDARVLNSFEELCIIQAVAINSFTRVLNPHGGEYILSSTNRPFRCITNEGGSKSSNPQQERRVIAEPFLDHTLTLFIKQKN